VSRILGTYQKYLPCFFYVSDELSAYKIQKYMQKSYLMHILVVYKSFAIDKTVSIAVKLSIEEGWEINRESVGDG